MFGSNNRIEMGATQNEAWRERCVMCGSGTDVWRSRGKLFFTAVNVRVAPPHAGWISRYDRAALLISGGRVRGAQVFVHELCDPNRQKLAPTVRLRLTLRGLRRS